MTKIVFFDIDGTLLDEEKKLPPKTKEGIEKLKENGVHVAIATGRSPFMYEDLRKELDIDSYISFNGQNVVFEGEEIYKKSIKQVDLEQLLEYGRKQNHPFVFLDEFVMKATKENHPYIKECLANLGFPHPDKDEYYYKNANIYQALVFGEEGIEKEYELQFDAFDFIRWHRYSVDVLPRGGSKANGIKMIADKMGIDMKDIIAFGDGLNDIEMLQSVGCGVAMGNAHELTKDVASFVTKDVSEDGIWNGLKELELI